MKKTLLNIEGLGRELDPDLDLWKTAKPHLERWMSEQVGWRGFLERIKIEVPNYAHMLPQLPRLAYQALTANNRASEDSSTLLKALLKEQRKTNKFLIFAVYFGGGILVGFLLRMIWQ